VKSGCDYLNNATIIARGQEGITYFCLLPLQEELKDEDQ
jgi:hypothetical protein